MLFTALSNTERRPNLSSENDENRSPLLTGDFSADDRAGLVFAGVDHSLADHIRAISERSRQ
jgi:hypothetical protein